MDRECATPGAMLRVPAWEMQSREVPRHCVGRVLCACKLEVFLSSSESATLAAPPLPCGNSGRSPTMSVSLAAFSEDGQCP